MRRYTEWTGPPRPLKDPAGPRADLEVTCHVTGCEETAAWWRTVNEHKTLGACLCDGHREALLVSWTMPPSPPLVLIAEQLTIGGTT